MRRTRGRLETALSVLTRLALAGVVALVATAPACKPRTPAPERVAEVDGDVLDAASDDKHVYFLVWKSPGAVIARMPIGGTTVEMLGEDNEAPRHIALTSDAIYWTTESNLKRMPKSGGAATLVAAHVDGPIAVDDRELYAFERKPSGQERLVARALAGSPVRVVLDVAHGGAFLALDGDSVYISRLGVSGGEVQRVPKAGGEPTSLAKTRFGGPLLLAGDEVYYCDTALYRVKRRGGEPAKVSSSCGERLAIVDGLVYASSESSSNGLGAYQNGNVMALVPGRYREMTFEGTSARGMLAAGGALYVAGRSKTQPRTTWLRFSTTRAR